MRLTVVKDPAMLDIALAGIPWDGGTPNKSVARHGLRVMRTQSKLLRLNHQVSGLSPYDQCQVADIGDSPVNPIDLMDSLVRIEAFRANSQCWCDSLECRRGTFDNATGIASDCQAEVCRADSIRCSFGY